MLWRLIFILLFVAFSGNAIAQNLAQEAVDFSAQDFAIRWLRGPSDWWIYYEIPANLQGLPLQPLIRRYVQAHDVAPTVDSRPLAQADVLNGLQWLGTISVIAESAREYDFTEGWQPWMSRATLAIYQLEKRSDQWTVLSMSTELAVPRTARFYKPTFYDLPAAPSSPSEPGLDPQASINNVIAQSLGSINECYRGVHEFFNDDLVGWALEKSMNLLFREAAKPGGLCDQYLKHASEIPFEISVPLLPWLSVNTEKLCKLIQHPRCPD
jgi:hypothetical protein